MLMRDVATTAMKEKHLKMEAENVFDEAMIIINRLHENLGCIGRNQIRSVASRCDVPALELEEHCKSLDLIIVNFMEVPK